MKIKQIKPKEESEEIKDTPSTDLKVQKTFLQRFKKNVYKLDFISRRHINKHQEISYLIDMRFGNGTRRRLVIKTIEETFTFRKKTYYLDLNKAWFDTSMNQYVLDYIETSPVPIDREILTNKDPNNPKNPFASVTPHSLKGVLNNEYIRSLVADRTNNLLYVIIAFTFILVLLNVIILLKTWGGTSGSS